MDFIKKHPSVVTSIVGISVIILTFFNEELVNRGSRLVWIAILGFVDLCAVNVGLGILLVALLVAFNAAAKNAVANDKLDAGVIFALPFGGFGAIIGLLQNPNYFNKTAVKIIFSVQLWFVIWLFVSFMLDMSRFFSNL